MKSRDAYRQKRIHGKGLCFMCRRVQTVIDIWKGILIMTALLVMLQGALLAQVTVRGQVQDAWGGEPLAFAHISVHGQNQGAATDIDGLFSLTLHQPARFFVVSYVGYKPDTVVIIEHKEHYTVSLERTRFSLSEVTISPGKNPAHRIIQKAVENRKHNDPHARGSYKLTTYNKLVATIDESLWDKDTLELNARQRRAREEFLHKHLFIMESVSQRFFLAPSRTKEKVIHTRVSGFQNPFFFMLATQLQSFTFYDDFISIGGHSRLVNPVSKGSTERYWFRIEDTAYINDPQDTVFIISFHQRARQSFNGMRGILHIGARDYAIRSVIASPASISDQVESSPEGTSMLIRQNYEKVEGEKWLPVQLNTEIIFYMGELGGVPIKIEGHTYVQDVEVNPEIQRRFFDENYLEMDENAAIRNDSMINVYRDGRFTQRDENTYPFVDSISEEMNLERRMEAMRIFLNGYIPWGPLNFDLNKILHYNNYEGVRLGMGITANQRFSRVITPSVYVGYGTRDGLWKYGGALEVHLWDQQDLKLVAEYEEDVREFGLLIERKSSSPLDALWYREYSVSRFDHQKLASLAMEFRALRFASIKAGWRTRDLDFFGDYRLTALNNQASILLDGIYTCELFANIRYAYGEHFIKTPWDKVSLGTRYPEVYLNYSRGTHWLNGQLQYHKLDMLISGSYHTKYNGAIHFNLLGGLASRNTPLSLQYAGLGSSEGFLFSSISFNTMGINEFSATRHLALFIEYDFYRTLFRWYSMAPSFRISTALLLGSQYGRHYHQGLTYKSPNKGYMESGVLLDGILLNPISGIGLGLFYRYGPYRYDKWEDNLVLKLIIKPKI